MRRRTGKYLSWQLRNHSDERPTMQSAVFYGFVTEDRMDDYGLEPGEFVIMQEASVRFDDGENLDELVLTNQNLILVNTMSRGLFKREKFIKRCPLARIRQANDIPQVMASKYHNDYYLQVVFDDETISLNFPSNPKRTAERWAEGIRNAALGDLAGIKTEETLPPEIADLVDGAKGVFGSLFSGGGKKEGPKPSKPTSVNRKCVGCHAPLSGKEGETVICPYCDTKQTL